jgi:cystathionine gamma-synthase
MRDPDNGYESGFVYGRSDNATVMQVEAILANLEGGDSALLFSSGMAAATALFLALEGPTHILAPEVMYWGFRQWLGEISRFGHSVSFVGGARRGSTR